jgi:hypothetical protein
MNKLVYVGLLLCIGGLIHNTITIGGLRRYFESDGLNLQMDTIIDNKIVSGLNKHYHILKGENELLLIRKER